MHIFKKIEIWVLYLLCVIFFITMICFGALVRDQLVSHKARFPFLSSIAIFLAEIPVNLMNLKTLSAPISDELIVGDMITFQGISGFKGKPLKGKEVYLLLSRYNGDLEQTVVELVDLRSFTVKKRWNPDIDKINRLVDQSLPEFKYIERDNNDKRGAIYHPFLTEDGGLIFYGDGPLRRVDKNSQLVWQNQTDVFHHSIEQDHEGNLWVPSRMYPYGLDEKYIGLDFGGFADDAITKVSQDGKILFQKSVSKLLMENNMGHLIAHINPYYDRDPIHLNDIQPVLIDSKYWSKGDLFLSMRHRSIVILYRPSTNKILWHNTKYLSFQHDVNILDDHRISIFNNNLQRSRAKRLEVNGNNEVVIYDFEKDAYSKYFSKPLRYYGIRTESDGRSKILENGDLVVEEQNYGRIFYFNKDESLQWQYVNRADNGNIYTLWWSRILHKLKDIKKVQRIQLTNKN